MQPTTPASHPNDYAFIMSPATPQKQRRSLPGGNSLLGKVVLATAGLIILVVILSIGKNIISPKPKLDGFVGILQDQQALIHIASEAALEPSLSVTNKNAAITTQTGLTSAQSELGTYLVNNGKKINAKLLNLKVSAATDEQLKQAASASTYNRTFKEIMESKLTAYSKALQQTYAKSGPNGRKILSRDYDAAQLLLTQLKADPSGS